MHTCHWPGCKKEVLPKFWGCRKHWYMLPHYLRSLIWHHYVPGQEETKTPSRSYLEAYEVVQDWIRDNYNVND